MRYDEARRSASRAKSYTIAAFVYGIVMMIITAIIIVIVVTTTKTTH